MGCGSSSGSSDSQISSAISGMALNAAGTTMYVANADSNIVETLNPTLVSPTVTTLAGAVGQAGTAEGTTTASAGRFYSPVGITQMGGDLYVADTGNSGIRKLTVAGVISNLAGNLGTAGSADATGSSATFFYPKGIANDGTYLYVADTYNHTIRRVTTAGAVTTIAGYAGASGSTDNLTGSIARFKYPYGITTCPTVVVGCDLYVSDSGNNTIRTVTTGGAVTLLAGSPAGTAGYADRPGNLATFNGPAGVVTDGTNVFVADSGNHTIRMIEISTGDVTTIAGAAGTYGSTDGTNGATARFNTPTGLALNTAGTILYVSDQNYTKVRKIVLPASPTAPTSSNVTVTTLTAAF